MIFSWSRLDSWYNYCNILEYFTWDFSSEFYFNYIFNRVFHCIIDPNLDGTVVSNMALSRFHRIAYMVAEEQDHQSIGEILYIIRRLLVIRLSEGWGGLGKKSLAEVVWLIRSRLILKLNWWIHLCVHIEEEIKKLTDPKLPFYNATRDEWQDTH